MANSPRPGLWILERSTDNGETYVPWQYFADTVSDCITHFGKESLPPIKRDNSVVCENKFSKVVPLEGGEIIVSLLNERPSAENFSHSLELQEWTKATNVRLRLLRTKTLLAHLMSIARQDPTVTRRYFYSIKDINIGGQCVCNGHANTCDITDPNDEYKLLCRCQHHTCGSQCDQCCPGYVQKKWRRASFNNPNECEPCNCNGHSRECLYDEDVDRDHLSVDIHGRNEGGGVCQNCLDNTEGINCDRCRPGFFRPYGRALNSTDVCKECECDLRYSTGNCAEGSGQCECRHEFLPPYCDKCNYGYYGYPECRPCDCHLNGTHGSVCEVGGGQCPCKSNYRGKNCDQCADGYYGFPDCNRCECNPVGALSPTCDIETGQCSCRNNFGGLWCDRCDVGFFNYPSCQYCTCDTQGCMPEICNNMTGTCLCKQGYSGPRCDQCSPSYYGYPDCIVCGCNDHGSVSSSCDSTGRCRCLPNFSGQKCDQCSPGHYNYPDCRACECDHSGSDGISCNLTGHCTCKSNFDGEKCDHCREGFYNYPLCEACNCNPAGVLPTFAGCGSLTSGELCECKERVAGRICNQCKPLYWNLKSNNPLGCEDCECYKPGTMGGMDICNNVTGQCLCKPNVVSRQCRQCRDGHFELLEDNLFGCKDCGCDIGGSVNNVCDKVTGQCSCRPRINGQRCNKPLQTHFFPNLHHVQYEIEDGRTPAGTQVRFGFDENIFPRFSWRGYAIYSDIQKEVMLDIYVDKPSLYQVLLKFLNFGGENVYGSITFTPDTFTEIQQSSDIVFEPTREPKYVRVSGKQGLTASPFVLNPGRWTVSVKVERPLFLDYLVLLPQSYYEATLLQEDVSRPCVLGDATELCQDFSYPSFPEDSVSVSGEAGYVPNGERRSNTQLYTDETVLEELGEEPMAWLNDNQKSLHLDLRVGKPGQYVLIIVYHTPEGGRTNHLNVELATTDHMQKGQAALYECNFTFLCREVVTDGDNKVAIFNVDSNSASVTLTMKDDASLTIERVVAIPYNKTAHQEWKTDYVLPQLHCIKKDGACKKMHYPKVPEAVKVEAESGFNVDRVTTDQPPSIQDEEVQLVYMDNNDPMVDIKGAVPSTGPYTFVVHYYQPHHPAFSMDVLIQNGQFYEAVLPLGPCPNTAGCRAVIVGRDTNSTSFQILQNFWLAIKTPNHTSVWLDYVLAIPVEQFETSILHPMKEDKAGVFITQCTQNNFDISPDVQGFCRDAVFSLTADYNNGALPCQCDIDGSLSFECSEFGGQCQCRPNVIGRSCSQCKTGFFGFPECKACSCPSTAICHPVSGQCICPPRVTGEKCDTCLPYTYGIDPIIGCEECNCNALGVHRSELQCHLESGQCPCKSSIVGRTCDECQAGYWAFPYCQLCNCDLRGTTDDICDQDNSKCYCKENVYGEYCDQCKPGTFFLEESNPHGCTKCFCFGTTDRCTSGYLYSVPLSEMEGWKGVLVSLDNILQENGEEVPVTIAGLSMKIEPSADIADSSLDQEYLYLVAPESYLGNKVSAYGGNISYSIITLVNQDSSAVGIGGPGDILLSGNNISIVHHHIEQPAANVPLEMKVTLVEREFTHLLTGSEVTREQLMMVLVNLEALYVRASYFQPATEIRVSNIQMDVVSGNYEPGAQSAVRVEQCQCPPNYKGSSCEECATGYFRAKTGPYLGYCVPCQCNDHSTTCDVHTGKCFDCKHNTKGHHCETCGAGYHGDATQGTPYDCLICACPLPIESNNFADSCEVSPSGHEISCSCKPGYYGPRCEVCAAGYYGQPEVPGSVCRLCQCSGNIDSSLPGSCDSVSGECVHCLNNTFGSACELCAPGFFGDAISRKDCKQCDCHTCGTDYCNNDHGECRCRPNVVGPRCDECLHAHWGLSSCYGCRSCDCDRASTDDQCDLETGQCPCRPGVTGKTCDVCDAGFWRYTPEGCISCNCALKFSAGVGCDPLTGQCQCLPGVIGEKCDSCPYRWVFIEKHGCQECEPCVHHLLDDADWLRATIAPLREELKDISGTYFAYRRLEYVNQTIEELRPEVESLTIDPTSLNLSPLEADVQFVEQQSDHFTRRSQNILEQAVQETHNAQEVYEEALDVEKHVKKSIRKIKDIVQEIEKLAEGLVASSGPNIDRLILEAERILEEIENKNFEPYLNDSSEQVDEADELLARVRSFLEPSEQGQKDLDNIQRKLNHLKNLLEDLNRNITASEDEAYRAQSINQESKRVPLRGIMEQVKNFSDNTTKTLDKAEDQLRQARAFLRDAQDAFRNLGVLSNELSIGVEDLRAYLEKLRNDLDDVEPVKEDARIHAQQLEEIAWYLDGLLADTRTSADAAVKAATAYESISDAINGSTEAAGEAERTAESVTSMSDGLTDQAFQSRNRSMALIEEARNLLNLGEAELLQQLQRAKLAVRGLEDQNYEIGSDLDMVDAELRRLETGSVAATASIASHNATTAHDTATGAREKVQEILSRLPEERDRASQVPRDYEETKHAIKAAHTYVDRISSLLPDIASLIDKVGQKDAGVKAQGTNIADKIAELKHKIALARDQANRVKLGVKFLPNTTLQLRNPEDLSKASTYTQLSLFFNTTVSDGLVAYIGSPVGTHKKLKRTLTDDFMAVEVRSSRLVLTMDLGSDSAQIINSKYIADGIWHQMIVERTGKVASLTVRTEEEKDQVAEGVLPGTYSVFNLDQHLSKFYIGGVPDTLHMQLKVLNRHFEGCIEGLEFGKTPLGLWNFEYAENNKDSCQERDQFVTLEQSNGLRFDGSGYVILPTGKHDFRDETFISMRFKTYAPNGLIFLVGSQDTFFVVEMKEGYLILKYNLGSNTATIRSDSTFNDGQWHSLEAAREGREAVLKVDGASLGERVATGSGEVLVTTDNIYVGGYPANHQIYTFGGIVDDHFEGCIMDLQIGAELEDLNKNKEALGVVSGCPETIARTVYFNNMAESYIAMPSIDQEISELTFKFKTASANGLLFYAANEDQSQTVSISLLNGGLVMRSEPGGEVRTSADLKYNNQEWHYVTATKRDQKLRLDIDDVDSYVVEAETNSRILTTTPLYFGGVPNDYEIYNEAAASVRNFVGCIGDTTINNKFQNFASTQDKKGISLASCPLTDPTDGETVIPASTARPIKGSTEAHVHVTTGDDQVQVRETEDYEDIKTTVPTPTTTEEPTEQCKLPLDPQDDTRVPVENGIRFGRQNYSHQEYPLNSALTASLLDSSEFALEFKTTQNDGVIFYVAGMKHVDFLGLFLHESKLTYMYNCGSGPAVITSRDQYNDGRWHHVMVKRDGINGRMIVDGTESVEGISGGIANSLNVRSPIYVGGLTDAVAVAAKNILKPVKRISTSFPGCLRFLEMNGDRLPPPKKNIAVSPCSDHAEDGTFFSSSGGYISLYDKFKVGGDLSVVLELKPRTTSGVLLSVHGKVDFFLLQLINGSVVLKVDNGVGIMTTVAAMPTPYYLCDGKWHMLLVAKAGNVLSLSVDNTYTSTHYGQSAVTSADTNNSLFVGGVPDPTNAKGVDTLEQFVGCMRIKELKSKQPSLLFAKAYGNVSLTYCPTI